MNIESEFNRQSEVARWINNNLAIPYSINPKNQLALGCFDLAIEHHAAICTLFSAGLYGSMYALLRSEFEAYVRGLWLNHSADEKQIADFMNEKLSLSFGEILEAVEKKIVYTEALLSNLKLKHWKKLCSFTHTGLQALSRRVNQTHTGAVNYDNQELISVLNLAGTFALLSATELAGMSGNHTLIEATLAKAEEYSAPQET